MPSSSDQATSVSTLTGLSNVDEVDAAQLNEGFAPSSPVLATYWRVRSAALAQFRLLLRVTAPLSDKRVEVQDAVGIFIQPTRSVPSHHAVCAADALSRLCRLCPVSDGPAGRRLCTCQDMCLVQQYPAFLQALVAINGTRVRKYAFRNSWCSGRRGLVRHGWRAGVTLTLRRVKILYAKVLGATACCAARAEQPETSSRITALASTSWRRPDAVGSRR